MISTHITIKDTFPSAVFFEFTGTPIHEENQKHKNTTQQYSAMSCTGIALLMAYAIKMCWGLIHISF